MDQMEMPNVNPEPCVLAYEFLIISHKEFDTDSAVPIMQLNFDGRNFRKIHLTLPILVASLWHTQAMPWSLTWLASY